MSTLSSPVRRAPSSKERGSDETHAKTDARSLCWHGGGLDGLVCRWSRLPEAEIVALRVQRDEQTAPCKLCHCCLDASDEHGEILGEWVARCEKAEAERDALHADIERLREALREAIDEYEDALQYKFEYFVKMHEDRETVVRLRAILAGAPAEEK